MSDTVPDVPAPPKLCLCCAVAGLRHEIVHDPTGITGWTHRATGESACRLPDGRTGHAVPAASGMACISGDRLSAVPDSVVADMVTAWTYVAKHSALTIVEYRRWWDECDMEWPGDAYIRTHFPVDDNRPDTAYGFVERQTELAVWERAISAFDNGTGWSHTL